MRSLSANARAWALRSRRLENMASEWSFCLSLRKSGPCVKVFLKRSCARRVSPSWAGGTHRLMPVRSGVSRAAPNPILTDFYSARPRDGRRGPRTQTLRDPQTRGKRNFEERFQREGFLLYSVAFRAHHRL